MTDARSGDERAPVEILELPMGVGSQESSPDTAEDQDDVGRDWDWQRDSVDIVLHRQPKTAVYVNTFNQIVIRQEPYCDDDPDVIVVIDRVHVEQVILALQQAAGLDR